MPTMIPVRTAAGHVRFVTSRQSAGEVAGKVLPRHPGVWRTAVKRHDASGPYWLAIYVAPTEAQVRDWENRPRNTNHSLQREFAH